MKCPTCNQLIPPTQQNVTVPRRILDLLWLARHPGQPMWWHALEEYPQEFEADLSAGYIEKKLGQYSGKDPEPKVGVVLTEKGMRFLESWGPRIRQAGYPWPPRIEKVK